MSPSAGPVHQSSLYEVFQSSGVGDDGLCCTLPWVCSEVFDEFPGPAVASSMSRASPDLIKISVLLDSSSETMRCSPLNRYFLPALLVTVLAGCGQGRDTARSSPGSTREVSFVEEEACAGCHEQQFRDWAGSHHDRAMEEATEESVLGDFNDVTFTHFNVTSRFFQSDRKFIVHTEGADGGMRDFEIRYTFGVEPLQQYLIEFPGGRLQSLGVAWDKEGERWFHLYPDERIPPEDPFHWTGRYQNWNFMCAECHSTNLRKNYDLESDTYDTTWDGIDVGCQSCHGPGEGHVAWASDVDAGDASAGRLGLIVDYATNDARFLVESCAPCHSRRHQVSTEDRPGEPFLDHFMPETLREGLYHADGQILDEVYVYGSFLQSRMYDEGVRCTDCHNPHSLELRDLGNAVCEQCHHLDPPRDRFATLTAKDYDSPEHHFHPAGGEGAQCVNCHMPERTYMVVDPRRDHSFRIPRPDLSLKLGTPNACNMCHTDETPEWADAALTRWFGPERQQQPHYGETIATGRRSEPGAAPRLIELAGDAEQPTIVRATALQLLRSYPAAGVPAVVEAVHDDDALVRATAVSELESLPPEERVQTASPLLRDPVRAVRIQAARVLAPASTELIGEDRQAFDAALSEYEALQMSLADTAPAHLNLGVIHAATGRQEPAVRDYEAAVSIDPGFLPARLNLATLLNEMGRNPDAEHVLREAIERHPREGEPHYSLGLLLAEMDRLEDAAVSLGRAAALLPERARVRYNYGLALQQLGRRQTAEFELRQAYRIAPRDPAFVQVLAIFYAQDGRWSEALRYGEELLELVPDEDGPRQFVERIRGEMARSPG